MCTDALHRRFAPTLCTDALSGETNLWRWIDAALRVDLNQARSSPSPPVDDPSIADTNDCEDDDIHGCDALAAAVDFDAFGSEIDELDDLPTDDDQDQD
jgi:hypothetical protein